MHVRERKFVLRQVINLIIKLFTLYCVRVFLVYRATSGAGRTIIGGANIHISLLTDCKNNRFQKKLITQNTNILIFAPPIIDLAAPLRATCEPVNLPVFINEQSRRRASTITLRRLRAGSYGKTNLYGNTFVGILYRISVIFWSKIRRNVNCFMSWNLRATNVLWLAPF